MSRQFINEELSELFLEVLAVEAMMILIGWVARRFSISNTKTPRVIKLIIRYVGQRFVFRIIQTLIFRVLIRVGLYTLVLGKS